MLNKILSFFLNRYNKLDNNNFYYLSLIKEGEDEWSIHGLWPQNSSTTYPSYCKKVDFDINKIKSLINLLNKYWYSDRVQDYDFWKHEWEKHGSCMFEEIDEYNYFNKTIELYEFVIKNVNIDKYYNNKNKKCLIPFDLNFNLM